MTDDPSAELSWLERPVGDADLRGLARLLSESVEAGEVVSFLAPLSAQQALGWWRGQLEGEAPGPRVLVARSGGELVGTVSLCPAWAPNQPHRAEITKLLVAAGHRGRGLGRRLMEAAEQEAERSGRWLLTLDAKKGEAAERLYRRLGWVHVGTIPDFALDPDGVTPHDAVVYYKRLASEERHDECGNVRNGDER